MSTVGIHIVFRVGALDPVCAHGRACMPQCRVQPDHLLIAALLLMRDKDDAGSRPDSYGPVYSLPVC